VEIIEKKRNFPKGTVFISVDDGWRENLKNIIETEEAADIPISIFVTIQPILDNEGFWWSYIDRGLSRGLKIRKKEILKNISNDERRIEIDKVKKMITIENESINLTELKVLSKNKNIFM
jgi:peptidoglycan/xylan/chitin deacetylase (PgdA/CDA1 family)